MDVDTIDEIKIEPDEHGWELVLYTDGGEKRRYLIGLPDQFWTETRKTIGAWIAEGEQYRVAMLAHPDDDAYAKNDPKHPMWHDNVSTIHDNREGK